MTPGSRWPRAKPDTIAAIAGQIAGAGLDCDELPWPQIRSIAEIAQVERGVIAFCELLA